MNKILLTLSFLTILACPLAAQDTENGHINRFKYHRSFFQRHEFGLTAGLFTRVDRFDRFEDYARDQQARYLLDKDRFFNRFSFTLGGHYLYHFNDRIAVGALVSWTTTDGFSVTHSEYEAPTTPQGNWRLLETWRGSINGNYFSVMPTVKYTWLIGKHITLYSKAGIGGDIEWFRFDGARVGAHNKINFRLGFQVTPIGINFGKGPVRFFSEIGYGSAAVLTAGVSCYLGKVKR